MTLTLNKEQAANLETRMARSRGNWERDVALLANEVQGWMAQGWMAQGWMAQGWMAQGWMAQEAAAQGWRVEREQKELAEEVVGGAYQVPVVTIYAAQGRLLLEPIARGALGAQGRVDLYA